MHTTGGSEKWEMSYYTRNQRISSGLFKAEMILSYTGPHKIIVHLYSVMFLYHSKLKCSNFIGYLQVSQHSNYVLYFTRFKILPVILHTKLKYMSLLRKIQSFSNRSPLFLWMYITKTVNNKTQS